MIFIKIDLMKMFQNQMGLILVLQMQKHIYKLIYFINKF